MLLSVVVLNGSGSMAGDGDAVNARRFSTFLVGGSMSQSSMKQNGTTKVTHIKNHIKNQHHQHSPSLAQHFQTLLSCLPHAVPSPPFSVFRHPSLCFFKGDHFATHPFTPKINGRFHTSFLHFEKDFTIAHHLFRAPIRVCQSSHQRHRS